MATDRSTRRLIADQQAVLRELTGDPRLAALRSRLPRPAVVGPDVAWMVQAASPGRPGGSLAHDLRPAARAAGLGFLEELHAATAEPAVITDRLLDQWVHDPVTTVAGTLRDAASARGLAALHDRLTTELLGTPVTLARLHGDPTPDNFLFDDDGTTVTAVVDWESTGTGLPECDLAAFILACRRQSDRRAARRRGRGDAARRVDRGRARRARRLVVGQRPRPPHHVRPARVAAPRRRQPRQGRPLRPQPLVDPRQRRPRPAGAGRRCSRRGDRRAHRRSRGAGRRAGIVAALGAPRHPALGRGGQHRPGLARLGGIGPDAAAPGTGPRRNHRVADLRAGSGPRRRQCARPHGGRCRRCRRRERRRLRGPPLCRDRVAGHAPARRRVPHLRPLVPRAALHRRGATGAQPADRARARSGPQRTRRTGPLTCRPSRRTPCRPSTTARPRTARSPVGCPDLNAA
ncbi:phosphotransferase family protein [Aquihabitans daechungensis]|uniref:phosphotransferase family protein n=1 Tax=Aquihabitans daechungensis TaxID=1052257 RepID=UPI003BA1C57A